MGKRGGAFAVQMQILNTAAMAGLGKVLPFSQLSKVQLALLGTLVSAHLGGICGLGEALRRFSREAEHSMENLERLEEGFCFDGRLSPERFFTALK